MQITIPEITSVWAIGISDKNEVVGFYQDIGATSSLIRGFWRTNDHPPILQYPLDDPNSVGVTRLYSINSGRIVVGAFQDANNASNGLYLNANQYSTFNVPGCAETWIREINDPGEMVGACLGIIPNNSSAWLYTNATGFLTLSVPGSTAASANAVNTAGAIVGEYWDALGHHGFLFDTQNNFTTIDFPGASETLATGINDAGVITGTFYEGSNSHGFLLSGNVFTQIDVPGQVNTILGQISNTGWFVGTCLTAKGRIAGFVAKPYAGASVWTERDE